MQSSQLILVCQCQQPQKCVSNRGVSRFQRVLLLNLNYETQTLASVTTRQPDYVFLTSLNDLTELDALEKFKQGIGPLGTGLIIMLWSAMEQAPRKLGLLLLYIITSCTRPCAAVAQSGEMEKKEKRKCTFLICLISQCLWVDSIFCCSIACADIEIVWFSDSRTRNI